MFKSIATTTILAGLAIASSASDLAAPAITQGRNLATLSPTLEGATQLIIIDDGLANVFSAGTITVTDNAKVYLHVLGDNNYVGELAITAS